MSVTTNSSTTVQFSIANHIGHGLGVLISVALLASWITKASAPRRFGGVALVLVGVASLGVLFVPDIGTAGRIANSVGALVQFGAAALVLLPSRTSN